MRRMRKGLEAEKISPCEDGEREAKFQVCLEHNRVVGNHEDGKGKRKGKGTEERKRCRGGYLEGPKSRQERRRGRDIELQGC